MPWLDFTRPWTEEQVCEAYGLTDEEVEWINERIPDYYNQGGRK